jgi:CheY-like chemotaxis protein
MKTLIVEDDFTSRLVLQGFLNTCGVSHVAVNGKEAVEAVRLALDQGEPERQRCVPGPVRRLPDQTHRQGEVDAGPAQAQAALVVRTRIPCGS